MKRSTFSILALAILLLAGILLAMGLAAQKKGPPVVVDAGYPGPLSTVPATMRVETLASRPTIQTLPATLAWTKPASQPAPAWLASPFTGTLPLEPGAHDPAIIKVGGYYYVFFTGGLINELRSTDLIHWQRLPRALPGPPGWIAANVPNNRNDLWAPDISFFNGKYQLYYAASTFGSRNSGIGLATTKSIDPASPDYKWSDDGMIVRTQQSDNYNAIDPNFALDENGRPWLTFGSFWSGIKLIKLGDDGKPDPQDKTIHSIAARARGSTAIKGPFIIHEGKYFYLFVSWDACCNGLRSTYRVMAGRAEKITGPYLDKDNVDMAAGGGTQLIAGDGKRIVVPGHCGLYKDGDYWLMALHFLDANTNGTARLQIRPVTFDEKGWPVLGKPINSPN